MQNSEEMLFLLLAIKHETSFSPTLLGQLGFSGMGRLCLEALKEELIINNEKGYRLTEKGMSYIEEQNNMLGRKGLDREIAKLLGALCPQLSVNSIYLPEDF